MSNSTDLTMRESWIKTHADSLSLVSQNTRESDWRVTRGQVTEEQHSIALKGFKYMTEYFKATRQ